MLHKINSQSLEDNHKSKQIANFHAVIPHKCIFYAIFICLFLQKLLIFMYFCIVTYETYI